MKERFVLISFDRQRQMIDNKKDKECFTEKRDRGFILIFCITLRKLK